MWIAWPFTRPAAFGPEHRWRIEHFAEVRGHELTTRRELFRDEPDHPRAEEEYYKLALGPLQTLPQPILAGRWKRITFLYTTGDLFGRARTVNDLVVRSEERQCLWRSLRERALQGGVTSPKTCPRWRLTLHSVFIGPDEIPLPASLDLERLFVARKGACAASPLSGNEQSLQIQPQNISKIINGGDYGIAH